MSGRKKRMSVLNVGERQKLYIRTMEENSFMR